MKRLSILAVACLVLAGLSSPFAASPASAATTNTSQALACGLGGNQTMTITGTAPDTAVQGTPFNVDLQPAQAVANGGAIKNLVWYFQAPAGSSIVAGSATTTGVGTGAIGTVTTEISGSLVLLKASGEIPNGGTFRPPNLRFQLNPTGAAGTNLQMKVQSSKAYSLTALGTIAINCTATAPVNAFTNTTIITVPGAPTIGTATAGNGQATVTWTAPAATGGSAITGYTVTPYLGATAQTPQVFASTATSQSVTGLTNGSAYTFKVAATNAAGTGTQSAASNAVTPQVPVTVPGAPTIGTASAGDGEATVTWTAPVSNGGSAITDYVVTPYIGATAQAPVTSTGTGTSKLVTGLANGTAYTFKVAAVNAVGTGSQSASSNAVTPIPAATAPGAPTGVSGLSGDGQVTVSWTAPVSNGGAAITGYVVTPYIGATAQAPVTSAGTGTSKLVTGLANGTAYTFKVAAVNAVGTGADSSASSPVTPATTPGAPTGVSGTAGNSQVTLSWTAPASNGGSAITGYVVTPYIGATAQPAQTFNSTATTQAVTGLTNGTAYTFRVAAVNAVGTGTASAASGALTPVGTPGAPTGLLAAAGNGQATLGWSAPADTGGSPLTGYVVTPYIGATAQTPQLFDATATLRTITGLANGTSYTFRVAAANAVGTGTSSAASNAVTPATTPGAPTGVSATPGNAQALVSWTAPASNGGSAVTGYVVTPYIGATAQTPQSFASTTTSQTISGLANGTAYTFKVAAVNGVGTGAESAASSAVTPVTTPGAPTIGSATAGNAQATVTWTAPVSNGGTAVTGYVVTPYIGATAQTPQTFASTATSQVVTGLANGTAYTFRVAAVNAVGTGASSGATSAVTPATTPGAPAIGAATAGNAQATVSWSAPASNGGSAITGYVVTPYLGATAQPAQTFNSTATTQVVTGLANGTAYTFRVAAVNAVGTGTPSGATNAVTPTTGATAPGAPTGVSGLSGDGQVTVSWTAPVSNGGAAITGYVVTPYIGATAQAPVTSAGTGTSKLVTGLANGTAYTFKVAAVNAVGTGADSSASSPVTPATLPGAPTIGAVTRGNGQATVTWTAPASNGGSAITGYVVTPYIGATAQTPQTFSSTATSQAVTGLTNGTAYTFRVAAVNGVGTGAPSGASNAVTPATTPGAPTGVTGTRGNAQVTLSWTAPASNGGSAITGYVVTPYIGATAQTPQTFSSTATSQAVTGLTNGTAYAFRVAAVNGVGTGSDSAASPAVTPATTPVAPLHIGVEPADQAVTVYWNAPVSNGGSAVTGYVVTPYIGATAQTPVAFDASATHRTVTGLTNGTAYTFTVAAVNGVGTGAASLPSAEVTPRTTPGAPTGVTGVPGKGGVNLSWTAPASNGGAAITGYVITPSIGATALTPVTSTGTGTSKQITGLANGTAYTFTVAAVNDAGTGTASAASAPITPRTAPTSPTGVSGVRGDGQVTVSWTAPADDGGSAITGYTVTPYIGATAQTPVTSTGTGTSKVITGLVNGTAYTFVVIAENAAGLGDWSAPSGAVTPATTAGAPTSVSGVRGDGQVTVSWTAPADDGGSAITGYVVTPHIGATAQPSVTSSGTGTSKTVSGLTNETAYTFTVAAVNDVGTGPASTASAAATPRAPFAPFASWAAFVTRQYLDVTAVAPSSTALATWVADLGAGTAEKGDLIEALRRGADNTNAVDPAVRLYRAFFNRIPDPAGFDFWVQRRRSGSWTLVRMADQFAGSSEFQRKYGTLTNRQFVSRIYTDVLGRAADPDGVDYWTRQLDLKRRNRGSVMVGFSESSEFKTKQAETTDAAVAHLFLLGRTPTASEASAWVTAQKGGTSPADLATALLDSAEYRTHAAS